MRTVAAAFRKGVAYARNLPDGVDDELALDIAEHHQTRKCSRPQFVGGGQYVRCNSRVAALCPACAEIRRGDVKRLMRSGMFDDDGHPMLNDQFYLVTLTAPSFGRVHSGPHKLTDKAKPCGCGTTHAFDDPVLGSALNPDTYDYRGALLWNNEMGALFNSTVRRWRRAFGKELAFFQVIEPQRRLLGHRHIIVRLPAGVRVNPHDLLIEAESTWVTLFTGERVMWGNKKHRDPRTGQMRTSNDVRVIEVGDDPEDAVRVVGYLSKYLAKSFTDKSDASGNIPPAAKAMLTYAREELECSHACRGVLLPGKDSPSTARSGCGGAIHSDLMGTRKVWSMSRNWSNLTQGQIREERRLFAAGLGVSDDAVEPEFAPELLLDSQDAELEPAAESTFTSFDTCANETYDFGVAYRDARLRGRWVPFCAVPPVGVDSEPITVGGAISGWLAELTDEDLAADWLANAEPDLPPEIVGLDDTALWAAGFVSQHTRELAGLRYAERVEQWEIFHAGDAVAEE